MKASLCTGLMMVAMVAGCASHGARTDDHVPPPPLGPSPMGIPASESKLMVLHMTGPDFVVKAKDWLAFQEEWRATFADHAKEAGIAFDVQKDDTPPPVGEGTRVDVYVNDYRMVGIGARVFFGVMTGNAYIDAKATYVGLSNGRALGERPYNTSSTAWAGVFAKMTPLQVDAIATQVFAEFGVLPSK